MVEWAEIRKCADTGEAHLVAKVFPCDASKEEIAKTFDSIWEWKSKVSGVVFEKGEGPVNGVPTLGYSL